MEDMKFKDLKLKYLDYQGKVMINVMTTASNKVLEDALNELEKWNKDLFKTKITRQGHMLEFIDLKEIIY